MNRPDVFISFLGITNYASQRYRSFAGDVGEVHPVETPFIQIARLSTLHQRGLAPRATILLTEEARDKNWARLSSELQSLGLDAAPVAVSAGKNPDEFWDVFNTIVECVPEKARVYVDMTHGFRTQPTLLLLALEFLEKLKDIQVVELTYGAGPDVEDGPTKPTWNLSPFLVIREWAAAVRVFLETGDVRFLARVVEAPTRQLAQILQARTPDSFRRLPKHLRQFGDAIHKCHASAARTAGVQLKQCVGKAKAEWTQADPACPNLNPLRPVVLMLAKIEDALVDFPERCDSPRNRLLADRASACWCLRFGLPMQGLTFLREAFVSAFIEICQLDGSRRDADWFFGALSAKAQGHRIDEHPHLAKLLAFVAQPPLDDESFKKMLKSIDKLITLRNNLDHAFTADQSKAPTSDDDFGNSGQEFVSSLDSLIAVVK